MSVMTVELQVGMNGGGAGAQTRTALIKDHARALGFDPIGIVAAEKLTREKALIEEWVNRGYHGEMSWMAQDPDQRTDPRKIFPQAQSVVVVALNYYTPHQHTDGAGTGKVS